MSHMVIIGGGVAGGTAAATLRREGFEGDVTLIAEEPHPPHQRPPLSKGYLAGTEDIDAVLLHPADWYAEHGIDLRQGVTATRLDPSARTVALADGATLTYDSVLLATGASPRPLPIPGADLPGVHMLRRIEDSEALAAALRAGDKRLVVIGSGWIGMEVAATARGFGNTVTVIGREAVPLANAIGTRFGQLFCGVHRAHGVDVRTEAGVEAITGTDRADGVVVDGETVPADLVLIGIGATPNTALAEAAGLRVSDGIHVDSGLHTSAPGVFAAGDVANPYHPVIQRHLRSEHWANALGTGKVAARSMRGLRARFDEIPYFYTDQFDLGMELSGYPPLMDGADIVVRGDVDAREFVAFWVDAGRVVGGMNVNVWDVNEHVQALIRSGARIDLARLADPGVPLADLAA
ncbi:NAD(P)/FAD-dependent oxidoreductase [Microbacterium sp. MC2]